MYAIKYFLLACLLWNSAVPRSFSFCLRLQNQLAVLPRRVADARTVVSDVQHCWRRVCLPARQCTNISRSWNFQASLLCDTPLWPTNSFT